MLVVRVRDLQRVAWRKGRPAARRVERDLWRSFVESAGKVLRAGDVLGHARDSEDFLAALVSSARNPATELSSVDCRAALQRIGAALAPGNGQDVESGWTMLHEARLADLPRAIERALETGVRERERFAFFSTVGHELRTPLSAVRGYLETVLDETLDFETTRRYLTTARAETMRMSRLVDGMFDISLLDLRGAPERAERAPLATAATAAAAAVTPLARARGCRVCINSGTDLEVGLAADALTQVLINLLDNALKHGKEGGIVALSAARRGSRVEVCVDDDGPGVPAEERESIFALGRRGPGVRAAGSGLGLAFVRLILERSGGAAEALVSPLGGARLRLCLPLPAD